MSGEKVIFALTYRFVVGAVWTVIAGNCFMIYQYLAAIRIYIIYLCVSHTRHSYPYLRIIAVQTETGGYVYRLCWVWRWQVTLFDRLITESAINPPSSPSLFFSLPHQCIRHLMSCLRCAVLELILVARLGAWCLPACHLSIKWDTLGKCLVKAFHFCLFRRPHITSVGMPCHHLPLIPSLCL